LRATVAAAFSDRAGAAMMRVSALAKRGSPGFGVSLAGSASQAATRSGMRIPYRAIWDMASALLEGSARVGPDATSEGSSPGMSDTISDTTLAG
jgi:hypothetical protein